jgi:hypothetical protein
MRFSEIAQRQCIEVDEIFKVATLFVPRGYVDRFIVVCSLHDGQIIQNRVLYRYNGFSVDVMTSSPSAAADLLGAWLDECSATTRDLNRSSSS